MDSAVAQCYSPSCTSGHPSAGSRKSMGSRRRTGSRSISPLDTPILQVRAAVEGALPPTPRQSVRRNGWRTLQNVVGGLAKQSEPENAAWTGDRFPGSVDALELHFVFPFSLSDERGRRNAAPNDEPDSVGGDPFALLFGDDGHLLFKDIATTVEITSVSMSLFSNWEELQ